MEKTTVPLRSWRLELTLVAQVPSLESLIAMEIFYFQVKSLHVNHEEVEGFIDELHDSLYPLIIKSRWTGQN